MADAFQYLQDDMAKRMASQFPTVPIPGQPALPSFLQQFANPATGGPVGPGGAPVTAGAPVGAAAGAPGAVPGGGPVFNPQGSTAAMNTAGFMDTPAGRAAMAAANPALLATPGGAPALPAALAKYAQQPGAAAPGGGLTPQQAFAQGFSANTPSFPNVLQMYGLNMPNPMTLLGGQPYVGMPV
jgi:hypothetical protein